MRFSAVGPAWSSLSRSNMARRARGGLGARKARLAGGDEPGPSPVRPGWTGRGMTHYSTPQAGRIQASIRRSYMYGLPPSPGGEQPRTSDLDELARVASSLRVCLRRAQAPSLSRGPLRVALCRQHVCARNSYPSPPVKSPENEIFYCRPGLGLRPGTPGWQHVCARKPCRARRG